MYKSEQSEDYLIDVTQAVMRTPTSAAVTLLSSVMYLDEWDMRSVMDELNLPVLFIASSQPWAVAEAKMVRERWPKTKVEILEDTGHALFVDKPDDFNRVIEEFLVTLLDR